MLTQMKTTAIPLIVFWTACLFGQASSAAGNNSGLHPCSLLNQSPNTTQAVDADELFQAYSSQVRLIHSLHLIAALKGTAGPEYEIGDSPLELAAILDLAQPNLIHITGVVPYQGSRVVDLTSDGHQFGLLVPEGDEKVFLTGPIDAPPQSDNVRENLRPRPFIEALRWDQGTPRAVTAKEPANTLGTRTLTIDVATTENTPTRRIEVVFDLAKGVVDTITAYDNKGVPLFKTRYEDWRTETGPSSGAGAECFARHIVLVELQQDYQLDIRISHLNLNPPMPKSYFRISPPHGVPIKHLDMAGGRSNR